MAGEVIILGEVEKDRRHEVAVNDAGVYSYLSQLNSYTVGHPLPRGH